MNINNCDILTVCLFGIINKGRNQKQAIFSFFELCDKTKKQYSAWFFVFFFFLIKNVSFSFLTDKTNLLLNISFHWWVGLHQPLASDWIVCSISYVCASGYSLKLRFYQRISITAVVLPLCHKTMQCLHKILHLVDSLLAKTNYIMQ